jgi:hypothetical protein
MPDRPRQGQPVTALADILSPADRDRLAAHMRELAGLARLAAERSSHQRPAPAPTPLAELAERGERTEVER